MRSKDISATQGKCQTDTKVLQQEVVRLAAALHIHLQRVHVPRAPKVLAAALQVHGPHGRAVHAVELARARRGARRDACQAVVRWRQREPKVFEELREYQPHLHLRKVPAEAAARAMRKGREAVGLRVPGGQRAAHVGEFLALEVAAWLELVHVRAPEVGVAVPRPVDDVHGGPTWQLDSGPIRALHLIIKLKLTVGATGNSRPHAQCLGDAAVQIIQLAGT
mmetsp:Transcript_20349/g.57253  ORF Transcript_20349/g.57253 Transcript_20349/m.57253 type:complete len:222 (-) Transcript_20349:949-1614(-)